MIGLLLRDARLEDVPRLLEIEQECFDTPVAFSARRIRDLIRHRRAVVRVGESGQTVLGWSVGLVRRHRRSISARVYNLGVDPSARGRGLGRALLADLFQAFADRGAGSIFLEVEASNAPALALYQSMGFVVRKSLPDYYAPGRHGVSLLLHGPSQPCGDQAAHTAQGPGQPAKPIMPPSSGRQDPPASLHKE